MYINCWCSKKCLRLCFSAAKSMPPISWQNVLRSTSHSLPSHEACDYKREHQNMVSRGLAEPHPYAPPLCVQSRKHYEPQWLEVHRHQEPQWLEGLAVCLWQCADILQDRKHYWLTRMNIINLKTGLPLYRP